MRRRPSSSVEAAPPANVVCLPRGPLSVAVVERFMQDRQRWEAGGASLRPLCSLCRARLRVVS